MREIEILSAVTAATIVERDGQYLFVKEHIGAIARPYGVLFARVTERRSLSSDRSHWPLCTGALLPHLTR